MNFNDINDSTIFYLKFIKAIFLSDNLTELLNLTEEFGIDYKSVELLKMMRDFVRPQTKEHSLPKSVADNIYSFVNISRFAYTAEDKKERFAVSNDIIDMLNASQDKPELHLYQAAIASYFPNVKDTFLHLLAYQNNPDLVKLELAAIAGLEYIILYTHSDVVDIDEFMEDVCEDLLLSSVYLVAVDHLLHEFPNIKYDKKFMARVKFVLRNNELLLKQYNGTLDEDCIYELSEDDDEDIKNDDFWKLHEKVKKKVGINKKGS